MEWLPIVFTVCIIPLLGILTGYITKWIAAKTEEIKVATDNELAQKYISMVSNTITDCVIATNQTYVDTLKAQGKFGEEAQKIALQKTLDAVLAILSQDAIEYLGSIYNDVNTHLLSEIEAEVNRNK